MLRQHAAGMHGERRVAEPDDLHKRLCRGEVHLVTSGPT